MLMNTGKIPMFAQLMDFHAMDYFHADRTGMAAITGSGRFPAPSNTAMAFAPS